MLSKKYKIKISDEDKSTILQMQKNYSIAFRKIYNSIGLVADDDFIKKIRDKYNISSKAYEYLAKECETFDKRDDGTIEERKNEIENLRKKMGKENRPYKRQKINKKIINLNRSLKGDVVFGGKNLLRNITKNKDNQQYKEQFKQNRILPLCFYGETARKGNRFFNLEGLSDGFVLFKYEASDIKINIELLLKKSDIALLKQFEGLALANKFPLTIKLTTKHIDIIYDEALLYGNKFDEKKFYDSIKEITDKDERKNLIRQAHIEFEEQMLANKNKNRYFSVDINPEGIGYCILDKKSNDPKGDFDIVKTKFIDFSGLDDNLPNKRKYELSIAIKYMFNQLSHYKCAYFVSEDLSGGNLGKGDNGNRNLNRKINNIWNRKFIDNLFTKYCNIRGIKRIPIKPAYSSFIGNINYNFFDPIASSIEIGRRGITKFIRGSSIFPEFCISNIVNGLEERFADSKVFSKKIYGNVDGCKSWKEVYKVFFTAKMSVRRKLENFNFSVNYLQSKKSKVKILCFL